MGAQIVAAIWQAPAGEFEAGIAAQVIEIVAIFIATSDGEDSGTQNVGEAVRNQGRVARVGDQRGERVDDAQAPFGGGEEHHAAIRCQTPTIEGGDDFLALDGWESERQNSVFGHGGCGASDSTTVGFDTRVSAANQMLSLHPPANPCHAVHKMG